MLKEIKRYDLVPNITKEQLLEAGFIEGGIESYILNPKVSYRCNLYENIDLYMEISTVSTKQIKFNDYKNIFVFDNIKKEPYFPFYKGIESEYTSRVIEEYNNKMNYFKEIGIFEEKVKQKVKKK